VFADDSRHAVAIVYGSAAILDLNGRGPISTAKSGYIGGALSPDGHRIVAARPDGTIDVLDGETLGPIAGPWKTTGLGASTAYFVVWSPDGRHVAARGHDPNIDILDTETGTIEVVPVSAGANFAETVAFTADGARLVVPDEFTGIEIVDIATKAKVVSAFEPTWGISFDASVNPAGNRVALDAAVGPETLLDSTDLRPAQTCEAETGYAVWSADGSRLAIGEHAGDVVVLDASCHRLVTLTGGHASPAVLFSSDGTRVLARDLNGTRLWDTASGRQIGNTFADPNYANGAFGITHDGRLFSLALRDQQLVLFDLDPAAWLTRACATAGRNLTPDEWSRYLGSLGPYRSTCPQYQTS
jgi:WD40 repeat protein